MKKFYLITLIALCFSSLSGLKAQSKGKKVSVAFYNQENLFDTIDGENNDADFLPEGVKHWTKERYELKLKHMAEAISVLADGKAPDILGLCEVENRGVVEDLVAQEALKKYNYQVVHFESPDKRGIDNALIYRPNKFAFTGAASHFVKLPEDYILTRDILEVNGLLMGEPVAILVGHWPSRSGGEKASMPRRLAAAKVMKQVTDNLMSQNKGQKVILMGDFNDDPNSPSLTEGLKSVNREADVKDGDLFNTTAKLYNKGYGTLAYRDTWNLFDNIVITSNLLNAPQNEWHVLRDKRTGAFGRISQNPNLIQKTGHYKGYPFRTFSGDKFQNGYSDHFPVFIYLVRSAK